MRELQQEAVWEPFSSLPMHPVLVSEAREELERLLEPLNRVGFLGFLNRKHGTIDLTL